MEICVYMYVIHIAIIQIKSNYLNVLFAEVFGSCFCISFSRKYFSLSSVEDSAKNNKYTHRSLSINV